MWGLGVTFLRGSRGYIRTKDYTGRYIGIHKDM